ncbi:chondroitinase family polysaccharide lyase [Photobacterium lutimaris]|uniref:Chondroitin lyase n=1 Tax=Photobacterium lutimaris TaxID=388278 RepID=A0A2T3J2D4_9GAMM|nr:chondroitinase family polysaccharide lyase [Photobacterium lutimaris]PSU35448.1 chondroitin lyase [Photobacterium lutimaris]TDR78494.1 chondroitin-sulfate-ABC endolyase/exolyase [Photobacterium lutimaris]
MKTHPLSRPLPGAIQILSLCVAAALWAPTTQANTGLTAHIESFEASTLPNDLSGQGTTLTTERAIMGDQALAWSWDQADASITLKRHFPRLSDQQANDAKGVYSGYTQVLSFWIYNDTAQDKDLRIKLGNATSFTDEFPVNLNFTGWRAVGVSLNNDFNLASSGSHAATMDLQQLRFQAPRGVASGSVIIDRVMVSIDDNRYQWSDNQITTRYDVPEIDFDLSSPLPAVSQAELDDAEQIKATLIDEFSGNPGSIDSLESRFAQFNIEKSPQGVISGRHIITDKQQVIYQPSHLSAADKQDFDQYAVLGESDSNGDKLSGYAELMLDLGKAYHHAAFVSERVRIAEMYLLMTEHLLDQGYTYGSSLVTTHHWGYSGRWWYISALMMEQPLASGHLLAPVYQALLWYSREFKESFDMALRPDSSNLDYFNTLSRQHLALLLLNPDDQERVALLHKFSTFFSGALAQTPPGTHDGLRNDGTAWRHHGHYPGYAFPAFDHAAHVIYMLKGTEYGVSAEAMDKLKNAMVAGWHYSNPYVPLALSGRHPFTDLSVGRYNNGIKWLAKSYPVLDHTLAAIHLQVGGYSQAQSKAIFGEEVEPALLPQGSWSFNGGAFAVHRSGDNMAVIKGYNQDVWSAEIYTNDNRYGRYQSHGSVHVMPEGNPVDSGYQQDGWDWNRNPGATTIHLDYDQLESPKSSTVMVRSDEGLSGATTFDNRYTLFSFKHKAPQNLAQFEPTFVAEKHVLAAGNQLYLTGNGISNQDGHNATETTLFQLAITPQTTGIWINGQHHDAATFNTELNSGDWIIDDNGVGYYLIEAGKVKVRRGTQQSRHNKTKADTSGQFSSAWIDHGAAPNNASYQYVMVMDTTPAEMASLASAFATTPRFSTLERTPNGHIINDRANNLYGYTSFAATDFTQGPVKHLDSASQLLVLQDKKEMSLSVSSLTLNIGEDDAPTQPVSIRIELAGKWDVDTQGISYYYQGNNTVVTVSSLFGQAVNVALSQDGGNDGNGSGDNGGGDSGGGGNGGDGDGNTGQPATGGSSGGTSSAYGLLILAILAARRAKL